MKFYSTRNRDLTVDFTQAIFSGLAPDGGLFHPAEVPDLRDLFVSLSPELPFADMAAQVISRLLPETFSDAGAMEVVRRAFPFSPQLRTLTERIMVLELFHGPSCAFKDFGASFLASSMEYLLQDAGHRAVILTATSGDTGSAVAKAFHQRPGIDVVILYPSGRVSPLQEKQLTTVGDNVIALEVEGSFDDCQRMVKEAFVDVDLKRRVPLTSANSINLGRLLPQALYYVYAFERLRKSTSGDFVFCVPSGNFGNLTAGILAWQWGLPVSEFIAATNANDVVPEYLDSGIFTPRPSVQTVANAMDVGNPSNFERMLEIFEGDQHRMSAIVTGEVVTDDDILATIGDVHRKHGVFLDPHTAAGVRAAERYLDGPGAQDATIVTLATADPAKFTEIVTKACGIAPPVPRRLAEAMEKEKISTRIAPTTQALKTQLVDRYDTHR